MSRSVGGGVPQPQSVLELGELLGSRGDRAGATQQYTLFRQEEALFTANQVTLDVEPPPFAADSGPPAEALVEIGRAPR